MAATVLRDLCQCPQCWNGQTQQRHGAFFYPESAAASVSRAAEALHIQWSDGHRSEFSSEVLRHFLEPPEPLPPKELWTSSVKFVTLAYDELSRAEGVRSFALQLHTLGLGLLSHVPISKEATRQVGGLLGSVRATTMYGADYEVRVRPEGNDSSFSGAPILHHTDGCYLKERPSLQLLHCMEPGAPGTGVSSLIDGLAVARELRASRPQVFQQLLKPVAYHFRDKHHLLHQEHPVIELDSGGEPKTISWNNYDRAALPSDPAQRDALKLWTEMLQDERWHADFQLEKGDLMVFDNTRLLHARKVQLAPHSARYYYGFYLDSNNIANAIRFPQPLQVLVGPREPVGDLRSDTKTQPSAPMRAAMLSCSLGDDLAGECPTTKELEVHVAQLCGMEAAVLVSSGTQGNLLAVGAQCPRGTEILVGRSSHLHLWEAGGTSALFGVSQRTVEEDPQGRLPLAALEKVLALSDPQDFHCSPTALVALENTHGGRAGAVLDPDYVASVAALCHRRGLKLHIDGARLFNAAASQGDLQTAVRRLLTGADSVSLCLSKGLGCPGGAVILGSNETVQRCRRLRKLVGGSMRQATGMLAAAGLHALRDRDLGEELRADHRRMGQLVEALTGLPDVTVEWGGTNMAVVTLAREELVKRVLMLAEREEVRLGTYLQGNSVRLVTHRDITDADVAATLRAFRGL